MTTFGIDRENNITACGSGEQIDSSAGETEVFGSQQELAALAEKYKVSEMNMYRIKSGENWGRIK